MRNWKESSVSIAGRMMSKRVMGKASFCNVQDLKGNIQSYVARDSVGEGELQGVQEAGCGRCDRHRRRSVQDKDR